MQNKAIHLYIRNSQRFGGAKIPSRLFKKKNSKTYGRSKM